MHYLIDGYNLLFRLLGESSKGMLEADRQYIIRELSEKVSTVDIDAIVVFDAQYQEGESTRSHYGRLEIHFTNHGETADEYILTRLKYTAGSTVTMLVTSDKQLSWLAKRQGARTESVEDFIASLNRRCRNKHKQKENAPKSTGSVKKNIVKERTTEKQKQQPKKTQAAEECFDYYLELFEELIETSNHNDASSHDSINKEQTPEAQLTKKTKKKKKSTKAANMLLTEESAFNYYLKAFENDSVKKED